MATDTKENNNTNDTFVASPDEWSNLLYPKTETSNNKANSNTETSSKVNHNTKNV